MATNIANTTSENIANTTLTTDFNVTPYYDDFDPTENYAKILFRPGYAVQARELTQIQSILQNQVDSLGKHIFKEGSLVLGGGFAIETRFDYVKINDKNATNNVVDVSTLAGKTLVGANTGLSAYVYKVLDGVQTTANTKTLYVRYLDSGSNNDSKNYVTNEILVANNGANVVSVSSNTTGYGSLFTINEGVVYAKNHFIRFPQQSVVIGRYTPNPTCRVGFLIDESIVNNTEDQTLLDPALESSNYSAPGADRFKLTPELVRIEINDNPGPPDYVDLFVVENGIARERKERSQYARLRDELAKRTYDESGDYLVNGMNVRVREHLNNGENGGLLTLAEGGSNSKIAVGIESGTAYVRGYEVSTLVTRYVETDKSTQYANVNGQQSSSGLGNYVISNQVTGTWIQDTGQSVALYDTAQRRLTEGEWAANNKTGSVIGYAKVKGLEYENGVLGTPTANVRIYLFDIQMNSGQVFSNVRSLFSVGGITPGFADVALDGNTAVLRDTTDPLLLYPTGATHTRSIKDTNNLSDTTFVFTKSDDISIATSGVFTITADSINGEEFIYGIQTDLGTSEKRQILLNFNESFNIAIPGTANTINNTNSVVGISGTFFTRLNVGDKVEFGTLGTTHFIESIANNASMTVTPGFTSNTNQVGVFKAYKLGDYIDLNNKGVAAGAARTISSTTTDLTFDLKETLGTSRSATISYRVSKSSAQQIAKELRPGRLVLINCASYGTTIGPFNLGFSDVYQINSIRRSSNTFTAVTDGVDVTNSFTFDNGQRDEHYDHSTITPSSIALSSTDHLLVNLDYFKPDFTSGSGYFSVDSYPIDDDSISTTTIQTSQIPIYRTRSTGILLDLKNCLDFRPIKIATATDTITLGSASINPATTNTFDSGVSGLQMVAPSSSIIYDYSYYLARRDLVAIDKDSNFTVVKGASSLNPVTPDTPPNSMSIATIYVPPYPSLSPFYSAILGRQDLSCVVSKLGTVRQTMKDIVAIKDRVNNLEYYNSLNALEKKALDYLILDENGNDRFKNGVFVDTFRDHSLGATDRSDYKISVDSINNEIRPIYDMNSIQYDIISNTNIAILGEVLCMSIDSESVHVSQETVTTTRNVETSTYRFVGLLTLTPSEDVWVDEQQLPDDYQTVGSTQDGGLVLSTEWNAWQAKITGYKLYDYLSNRLIATAATQSEAQALAFRLASTRNPDGSWKSQFDITVDGSKAWKTMEFGGVVVEAVYDNTRTGKEIRNDVYTDTRVISDAVVDIKIVPYIRPQIIAMHGRGLKPKTKFYTFFDGQPMTEYTYQTNPGYEPGQIGILGFPDSNVGGPILSSANGEFWAVLRIPSETSGKKFRTGMKEVVVIDTTTLQGNYYKVDSATSSAVAYFFSEGKIEYKQKTILTTRRVIPTEHEIRDYKQTEQFAFQQNIHCDWSCMAYSFLVKAPPTEEGIFLTSVDIWPAGIDDKYGIWIELREMSSDGGITRTQIPMSEVWLSPDELRPYVVDPANVTPTSFNNPLKVRFKSPIFLYNDTQYAFIIHVQAMNPNTYFWVSKLGERDKVTGSVVNSRPLTGTLYTTNNNLNWDIVPDMDLKVRFWRAKFDVNSTGVAVLGQKAYESLNLIGATDKFAFYGERLTCDKITLANTTNPNVMAGDIIQTSVSYPKYNVVTNTTTTVTQTVNVAITANTSNQYYYLPTVGLANSSNVIIYHSNGTIKTTATVTTIKTKTAKLYKFRDLNAPRLTKQLYVDNLETLYVTSPTATTNVTSTNVMIRTPLITSNYVCEIINSSGNWEANDVIHGEISNTIGVVGETKGFDYSVLDFVPAYLNFTKTTVGFDFRGVANTTSPALSPWFPISPNENFYFNTEQLVLSRSREVAQLAGERSSQIRVTMRTQTEFLSPIVDVSKTHSVYVHNIVNNNVTNEETPYGGSLINKYISKTITLAEGQDAEDIKLFITGYRPVGTDIRIWIKIKHNEDAETLDKKDWVELRRSGDAVFSSSSNLDDAKEYQYYFPGIEHDRLAVANTSAANTINIGDRLIGVNSAVSGVVTRFKSPNIYIMDTTGYSVGEKANIAFANGTTKGGNTTISYIGKTPAINGPISGEVVYTTDNGIRFSGFKQFQIKIGLTANNSAVVPRVLDLRTIALQM